MVKIMMHGCNGVMGQVISKIVEETEGAVMACGVDRVDDGHNDYPVFTDINACDVEVDSYMTEAREENSVQRKRLESQQSVVERSLENMRSFLQDRMKLLS